MTAIIKGSIQDVSKNGDKALAIMSARIVLLCDRSSSMTEEARGNKARYEIEDDVVKRLQNKHPGQVALVAFNDTAWLCPDGNLPDPYGNTNMLDAFRVAQPLADVGLRVVLITDGEPSHDEAEVIQAAMEFRGKLDTIYCGPELSPGADFLKRLALAVGGSNSMCDLKKDPEFLETSLTRLMLAAGGDD